MGAALLAKMLFTQQLGAQRSSATSCLVRALSPVVRLLSGGRPERAPKGLSVASRLLAAGPSNDLP
eukprot:8737906-Alexandrium_andersonii.AAC.1